MFLSNTPNALAPHVVVVGLEAQVMEQLPTNELSGEPVQVTKRLFRLKAGDLAIAQRRLNEFLQHLQEITDS